MYLHQKFAFPVACLVFGLLALSLGRLEQQGQQARQLRGRAGGRLRLLRPDDDRLVADQGARVPGQPGPLAAEHRARARRCRAAGLPAPARRRRRPDQPADAGGDPGAIERRLPWRRVASPAVEASAAAAREAEAGAANPATAVGAAPRRRRSSSSFACRAAWPSWCDCPVRRSSTPTSARPTCGCCVLAFAGMLGIFYIGSFIDWSDNLFKGQATAAQLAQFLWYSTPQFVYYVLPLSALVGTLVTIGLLTKSSELIVMRACGVSLYRTALPLLVLGLALERPALRSRGVVPRRLEPQGGRAQAPDARRAAADLRRAGAAMGGGPRRPHLSLHLFRSSRPDPERSRGLPVHRQALGPERDDVGAVGVVPGRRLDVARRPGLDAALHQRRRRRIHAHRRSGRWSSRRRRTSGRSSRTPIASASPTCAATSPRCGSAASTSSRIASPCTGRSPSRSSPW